MPYSGYGRRFRGGIGMRVSSGGSSGALWRVGRADEAIEHYDIAKSRLIVMAPGTIWETKQWRSDGFAEVARHFLQNGFAVVLIGSEREAAVCARVAAAAPGTVNLAGETTLSELAALIRFVAEHPDA